MKVKLLLKPIFENVPSEQMLRDYSIFESIYAIRKLKALADCLENGSIEVNDDINDFGQVYCKKYEIWIGNGEFSILNEPATVMDFINLVDPDFNKISKPLVTYKIVSRDPVTKRQIKKRVYTSREDFIKYKDDVIKRYHYHHDVEIYQMIDENQWELIQSIPKIMYWISQKDMNDETIWRT